MDLAKAQRIIDAFGPCTTVYECMTAAELLKEYEEDNACTLTGPCTEEQFVQMQLDGESIHMDRSCDAAYYEEEGRGPVGHHAKVVSESDRRLEEIKQRLVAAGLL